MLSLMSYINCKPLSLRKRSERSFKNFPRTTGWFRGAGGAGCKNGGTRRNERNDDCTSPLSLLSIFTSSSTPLLLYSLHNKERFPFGLRIERRKLERCLVVYWTEDCRLKRVANCAVYSSLHSELPSYILFL